MPAGVDATVPDPVPMRPTVRLSCGGGTRPKVAVQVPLALSVMAVVALMPAQSPDQAVNTEPAAGEAVKLIRDPCENAALQVLPQAMPLGVEFTVPEPAPARATVSVYGVGAMAVKAKLALQERLRDFITNVTEVALPAQEPDQPAKVEPLAGVAVSVTVTLRLNDALHAVPQEMPAGADVTTPLPAPCLVTESVAASDVPGSARPTQVMHDSNIAQAACLAEPRWPAIDESFINEMLQNRTILRTKRISFFPDEPRRRWLSGGIAGLSQRLCQRNYC